LQPFFSTKTLYFKAHWGKVDFPEGNLFSMAKERILVVDDEEPIEKLSRRC